MQALYRKYRSESFADVVGQPQVTDILELALKKNRTSHGYLFVGPRGVGKTSVARILAHAINNLPYSKESNHLDIIEIDAASNTGVDNIRELIEKAQIAPSIADKKVYIIDEVHMLSKSAFNAFLKLLEEPPAHVVFILATTDEHKIPPTVISRTQRFVFKKISNSAIVKHLKTIADKEKIKISDKSLEAIARYSDGSFRDAINLLDQVSTLSDSKHSISDETVNRIIGLIPSEILENLISAYTDGDLAKIVKLLDDLNASNYEAYEIAKQTILQARLGLLTEPNLIELITNLSEVEPAKDQETKLLIALCTKFKNHTIDVKSEKQKAQTKESNLKATVPIVKSSIKKIKAEHSKTAHGSLPCDLSNFDWQKLLELAQTKNLPLYSLLSKSGAQTKGEALIISTTGEFFKKRLEGQKYNQMLFSILNDLGFKGATVKIIVDENISKSKEAIGKIKEIMGGGEEVSVDA